MSATIKLRRGTAAEWVSANPTLAVGEAGFETDTLKMKIGDGATAFTTLSYISGAGVTQYTDAMAKAAAVADAINDDPKSPTIKTSKEPNKINLSDFRDIMKIISYQAINGS